LLGIGLIVASTVFFSSSDVITKELAVTVPAVEIAWFRFLVFSLLVLPVVLRSGAGVALRSVRPGLQVVRALGVVSSALLFTAGLHFLPVAEASATNFVSPIFITALSIPLLGEIVGWRRWAAALVGLMGVLMVIRPGTSAFDPAALLPLLAALSWAFAAVATRKISGFDGPVTTLAYSAFVGLLVLTIALPVPLGPARLARARARRLHRPPFHGWSWSRRCRVSPCCCFDARSLHLRPACWISSARLSGVRSDPGRVDLGRRRRDHRQWPLHGPSRAHPRTRLIRSRSRDGG
jgi:drug/metabolite transporter (DMT)-like permease